MFFRLFAPALALAMAFAPSLKAQNVAPQGRGNATRPTTEAETPTTGNDVGDYNVAKSLDDNGQKAAAITAYRKFLKRFPASPVAGKAQVRVAELLEETGNLNKAFDAYQTLVTRYPDTPEFEKAIAAQIIIANKFLNGQRVAVLGINFVPGVERSQKMYESILKSAPYSKHAPVAQFNLGLSLERQRKVNEARTAFQTVLDKYPNSDVSDDALYQIAYIYMQVGITGQSQDLSALVLAKDTYEDFKLQFPESEKNAQAGDNLKTIKGREASDLLSIAKYYDWKHDYKAAFIYYNDIIRRQSGSKEVEYAKARVDELRNTLGEDALRVGSEHAETGEKVALRRRLQAQIETSALADYSGPSRRDIVPDELPVSKPKLRTNIRDIQPLPPVEPALPTQ